MEKDICRNRHGGSETSVEAFRTTPRGARARQRSAVLRAIKTTGTVGAICEEIAIGLGIPYTAASARFSELKRNGEITHHGERRKTTHGKNAKAYVAVGLDLFGEPVVR